MGDKPPSVNLGHWSLLGVPWVRFGGDQAHHPKKIHFRSKKYPLMLDKPWALGSSNSQLFPGFASVGLEHINYHPQKQVNQ